MDVADEELHTLYQWVDGIPLSRPKRNIARDFADGVLVAETVAHYHPRLVELHNYSAANGLAQKMYNWQTLNTRVFKRLNFTVAKEDAERVAQCEPGAIERVLKLLKVKLARYKQGAGGKAAAALTGKGTTGLGAAVSGRPPPAPAAAAAMQQQVPAAPVALAQPAATAVPVATPAAAAPFPPPGAAQPPGRTPLAPALAAQQFAAPPADARTAQLLAEKDAALAELKETNDILETKVRKLEQLVRLKDAKISTLAAKLQSFGG